MNAKLSEGVLQHRLALPSEDGDIMHLNTYDPVSLLSCMLKEAPALQHAYDRAFAKHPCSFQTPWDMVIIFDELAPGNKLHYDNRRKLMLMSLSFLQLEETLRVDDSWLTVLAARASIVGDVCGGFGTVFAKYIEAIASTPESPLTAGAFVTVNNAPRLLVAKVTCVVADGDGHRQVLNWKGASSTKPCFRHFNVTKFNSGAIGRDGDLPVVDIACYDPSKFRRASNQFLRESMECMFDAHRCYESELRMRPAPKRKTWSQTKLVALSRSLGFHPNPLHVLVGPSCAHVEMTAFRYDWVHVYLQDGVFSHAMPLVIKALKIDTDDLCIACDSWTFCHSERHKLKQVARIFHRGHQEKLKANLAESLSCYGLARHFVEALVGNDGSGDALQAFRHLCRCLDCILLRKYCMDVDPKATQAALMHHTAQFMLHHVLAHGEGHIKPKRHWMLDVAEMLDWDLFMVDGFTVERLHLRGKFLLEYILQPSAVENSCLASILTRQVGHLQGIERTSLAISGELGNKSVEFQGCRVGDSMRIRGFEVHVDDVVFDQERGRCGRIVACVAQYEHLMLFLILLRKVEDVTCVASRWREDVACETALRCSTIHSCFGVAGLWG